MKDLAQCETVVPCSVGGTNLVAGGSDESADNAHDVSLIVGCLRCALARAGYLPRFMGVIHPRFRTCVSPKRDPNGNGAGSRTQTDLGAIIDWEGNR
jgi:hypothetical protein